MSLQGPIWLGLSAVLCALALTVLLWRQLSAAKRATRQVRRLLASSLDTLDVGLEIWDAQDRLVLYNKKINQIYSGFHTPADVGQSFEALMRAKLERHLIPAAVGSEQKGLEQRLASRGRHKEHVLKALTGNQRLAQQTNMDELTGLANRRRLYKALTTEWQRAARSLTPLSLLMVDIDQFKNYNDRYGHLAGDECLRRVARVLDHCVRRAGELVARYGGEEFVLLLPGADMAHACETAQMCLDLMQRESLPHAASPTATQVTLSIGVACALPDAMLDDPASLVNAADAAMYRAKSSGRAHYEVATQADWEIDKDTPRTQPSPLI